MNIGVDQRSDPAGVQRSVQFKVDGPSIISAQLSGVDSGKMRLCLVRNDPPQKQCIVVHSGTLTIPVYDAVQSEWNLTLLGSSGVPGQYGTVTLRFNSVTPTITLESFRFNGTDDPHYNGFMVLLDAGSAGNLTFHAEFDGVQSSYQWHLNVANDDINVVDETDGPSSSVDRTAALSAGPRYSVIFEEPEPAAALSAFVNATFSWP